MLDLQGLLYTPVYDTWGVPATGLGSTVTVLDRTAGISIPDSRTQIETVRPVALVRAAELAAAGISVDDLVDNQITFNGQTWRIKAYRPVPSPEGETAGEVMLMLLSEG